MIYNFHILLFPMWNYTPLGNCLLLKLGNVILIKSFGLYSNKIPRNDWLTSAIINSCDTKEKLYNRLKYSPDNYELKNKYKTFCKNLTNVIKAAKTKYDKSLIEKNSSDPRKVWACINNKIGRNKNKSDTTIKQIKNESNTIIKNKT